MKKKGGNLSRLIGIYKTKTKTKTTRPLTDEDIEKFKKDFESEKHQYDVKPFVVCNE